jgi:riboflavin kinase, archaea type
MANLSFRGRVYSGKGEGKKFIVLPWVEHQIREKLGFTPYAGTLNIRLDRNSLALKEKLKKAPRLELVPEEGYCRAELIKAKITGLDCAIIIPFVPKYPPDEMEVISPYFLRQRLHLADGSEAAVTLSVK